MGNESVRNLPEPQHLILDIRGKGFNRNCVGQNLWSAFSRTSVPRAVPVTEERNLISKETNPGCGAGHEKITAASSSPATRRPRTMHKHTVKEGKKKLKRMIWTQRNHSLVLHHPTERREKKSLSLPSTLLAANVSCQLCTFTFLEGFS